MKIIVEGPDNVGKSTLIDKIVKEYKKNYLMLHYYANPTKDIQWGKDQYNQMFDVFHTYNDVIADRAHLGELVYPKMYHGYDGSYVTDIEKKYNTNDIMLVVLIDDPENLIDRDDGLSFSTELEKKKKEIQLFEDAFWVSTIENKILINIKNLDADQVFAKVQKTIKDHNEGKKLHETK